MILAGGPGDDSVIITGRVARVGEGRHRKAESGCECLGIEMGAKKINEDEQVHKNLYKGKFI